MTVKHVTCELPEQHYHDRMAGNYINHIDVSTPAKSILLRHFYPRSTEQQEDIKKAPSPYTGQDPAREARMRENRAI